MTKTPSDKKFSSYAEFYPFYLSQHADLTCRKLHYLGTTLVLILLAHSLFTANYLLLVALPVAGYFFAWVGHFGFEKNRPATFTYPLWSLMGDFHMYWDAMTMQLGPKLAVANETYNKAES